MRDLLRSRGLGEGYRRGGLRRNRRGRSTAGLAATLMFGAMPLPFTFGESVTITEHPPVEFENDVQVQRSFLPGFAQPRQPSHKSPLLPPCAL